jgi:hypothetical protein
VVEEMTNQWEYQEKIKSSMMQLIMANKLADWINVQLM